METDKKEYEIDYTETFLDDIERHRKAGTRSILAKIERLIEELRSHPTTGSGNIEQLKGDRKGQWSRRITQKHRLVYEIKEDIVIVMLWECWGHYDDK